MELFFNWDILLGAMAMLLLIFYFRSRNAVWGGFTLGIVIGLVLAIFFFLRGNSFEWLIVYRGAVFGMLLGLAFELLGMSVNILIKHFR